MSLIPKPVHKRIAVFFLCLVCLFTAALSLTAHALIDSAAVTLCVDQTFTKNSTALGLKSEFSYEFLPLKATNPMPAGSLGNIYTFKIDGTDVFYISPITFTETGVYQYQIKGVFPSSALGYTYDDQVYTITVYVRTPDQKNLIADIMLQKSDGSKVDGVKFEHIYTPLASKSELMVDPPVQKTVSGSPSKAGVFTFLLTAGNPENPMPAGSVNGVKTISIAGPGEKEFGTWTYTAEGTYYYTISEKNTGEAGYTYDSTVYTITDVVKDVNGWLAVSRTVTNGSNKQVQTCTFINKYSKNGIDGPKTGDDAGNELYAILVRLGVIIAVGCILYLLSVRKHGKDSPDRGKRTIGNT